MNCGANFWPWTLVDAAVVVCSEKQSLVWRRTIQMLEKALIDSLYVIKELSFTPFPTYVCVHLFTIHIAHFLPFFILLEETTYLKSRLDLLILTTPLASTISTYTNHKHEQVGWKNNVPNGLHGEGHSARSRQ